MIPHLAQPFQYIRGAAAVVDQDSPDEVAQCVATVLAYPTGFALELPEFGTPPQELQAPINVAVIEAAVTRWEPRARANADAGLIDLASLTQSVTVGTP